MANSRLEVVKNAKAEPLAKAPPYYDVPAIKVRQADHVIYLIAATAKQLKTWSDQQILLVERFQLNEYGAFGGYQRGISSERARAIARFIRGDFAAHDVILPMLPSTVLLNARPSGGRPVFTKLDDQTGTLRIFDSTRLAQVDGQHRIAGLIAAAGDDPTFEDFTLPVSIVDRLELPQEAAQFLTINTNQTKVKADLELRVIASRSHEDAIRLAEALRFDEWRLKGLAITILLDDEPSPWNHAISGPDDNEKEVVAERTFIESLAPICQESRTLGRLVSDDVASFLSTYWSVIQERYPSAWGEEWKSHLLRRTTGVYAFHSIAPLVYDLCQIRHEDTSKKTIKKVLDPILRDRETAWKRTTGAYAKFGTGATAWRRISVQMGLKLLPGLKLNEKAFTALEKKARTKVLQKRLQSARTVFNPPSMREFTKANIKQLAPGKTGGVYVLVSLNSDGSPRNVYVGKSDAGLAARLGKHHKDPKHTWRLFNAETNADLKKITALEAALWHIIPNGLLVANIAHPPNCPYCAKPKKTTSRSSRKKMTLKTAGRSRNKTSVRKRTSTTRRAPARNKAAGRKTSAARKKPSARRKTTTR